MHYRRLLASLLTAAMIASPTLTFAQDSAAQQTDAPQQAQTPDEPRGSAHDDADANKPPTDTATAWKKTFAPADAASYLPAGGEASVIVVAAGAHAEAELAADTLEAALRESGEFKLVMNDDVLADNSKVDDERIVEKAKHLPVGHVAVVRVYAGAATKPPTAVVSIYDKETGEAVTAMSATRGTPVAANTQPRPQDGGASKATPGETGRDETGDESADEAKEMSKASSKAVEQAKKEYLERYLWFDDGAGVDQYGGVVHWTKVYRGKYKEEVDADEFYREVGGSELAEEFDKHFRAKAGLAIVGGLAMFGGFSASFALQEDCYKAADVAQCEGRNSTTWTVGSIVSGVGFVMALTGLLYNPHPIEASEARRLVEQYNNKLKDELDLPADAIDEEQTGLDWSIDVTGDSSGAGLQLRARF